jgi:hypothetical protein
MCPTKCSDGTFALRSVRTASVIAVLACNNSYMGVKKVSPYNPNMSLGICAYGGVLLYAMCKYLMFIPRAGMFMLKHQPPLYFLLDPMGNCRILLQLSSTQVGECGRQAPPL